MPALPRLLLCASLAGLPALAEAGPHTIGDCEKIEAADTYNRCLASFGPPARSLKLSAEAPAERGNESATDLVETAEPHPAAGKHGRSARRAARHVARTQQLIRAKRMVFSVVSDRTR